MSFTHAATAYETCFATLSGLEILSRVASAFSSSMKATSPLTMLRMTCAEERAYRAEATAIMASLEPLRGRLMRMYMHIMYSTVYAPANQERLARFMQELMGWGRTIEYCFDLFESTNASAQIHPESGLAWEVLTQRAAKDA